MKDGETNLDFSLKIILPQCLYLLFRDETFLTPAVCMMWWAVDPGFSTYPWNRCGHIILNLFVQQIHRKSLSKDDNIAFQLFEFIATYNLRPCYSIVKAGNNVHTQKSSNTIDFILITFGAFFTKIVWRISSRIIKGFSVLLAPYIHK
jgi:hypothetical protein